MDVAHEQNQIGGPGGRYRPGPWAKGAELDLTIEFLVRLKPGFEGVVDGDLGRVRSGALGETCQIKRSPALIQIGRQDLDVPAAAGPEVDHGHPGLQAEETQGLDRMAPDVARLVRRRAPRTGDSPFQRAFRRSRRDSGRLRGGFVFLLAAGGQTGEGGHTGARQDRASRRSLSHARLPA
ncbi:hypothetical protein D3C80_1252660 [compost metagenome]